MNVKRAIRRSRSRGITAVPQLAEGVLVFSCAVALFVAEFGMSRSVRACRAANDSADMSATMASASYCQPRDLGDLVNLAQTMPTMFETPKPDVQSAISAVAGLGLGGQRTFPYYILPMQNIKVEGTSSANVRFFPQQQRETLQFTRHRGMGCNERTLDIPDGSLDLYRLMIWIKKFMGY